MKSPPWFDEPRKATCFRRRPGRGNNQTLPIRLALRMLVSDPCLMGTALRFDHRTAILVRNRRIHAGSRIRHRSLFLIHLASRRAKHAAPCNDLLLLALVISRDTYKHSRSHGKCGIQPYRAHTAWEEKKTSPPADEHQASASLRVV